MDAPLHACCVAFGLAADGCLEGALVCAHVIAALYGGGCWGRWVAGVREVVRRCAAICHGAADAAVAPVGARLGPRPTPSGAVAVSSPPGLPCF